MRYDIAESLTAAEVINSFRENDLNDIFGNMERKDIAEESLRKLLKKERKKNFNYI